jgi:quercetin dioxygenase-like cupin family protein
MYHGYLSTAALIMGVALYQMPVFAADAQPSPPAAVVEQLMDKDMVGVPGKELLMLTVEYPPGAASLPHRHDAQVLVYVLEGEVIMQVAGSPAVTLHRGQTFYENPTDVHVVSANASKTAPAKILVFMVKEKNAPVSRAATPKGAP